MARAPNILFLLPDQLRPDFLGCYGADFLRTPAIDGLARSGVRYTTAISPSPICVPARASLLTGQDAHAAGIIDNLSWLRPDRRLMGIASWPELLGQAAYDTVAIGKMHFYPWDLHEGFGQRIIAEDKRHIAIEDDYAAALADAGQRKLHGREQRGYRAHQGASLSDLPDHLQVDRWVADQACDWLRGRSAVGDKPFALMVGFPGPHCPYDPPQAALAAIDAQRLPRPMAPTADSQSHRAAFVASYRRDWADLDYTDLPLDVVLRLRQHYAALVERLDQDVAAILQALHDSGQADNTVVVLASDHGDYLGDFGLMGKTYFHEPSIRIPVIWSDLRARSAAQVVEQPVSLLDIFPTLLAWAGLPPQRQAHGRSLLEPALAERSIVGATVHGVMARDARHKLVRYRNGSQALYDLAQDPHEQHDCMNAASAGIARERLEQALFNSLLQGLIDGHADKHVGDAKAIAPHPFYARGWSRPYPAHP